MPAERSGCLTLSSDWVDGWCRSTAAAERQSRNAVLADSIRVPAIRTAANCQAYARTKLTGQPQYRQSQHRQTETGHDASHSNTNHEAANEHGSTARRYMNNSFILSEVRKALRHHPDATTAVRIHFDDLVDRLEAEAAGGQKQERLAA